MRGKKWPMENKYDIERARESRWERMEKKLKELEVHSFAQRIEQKKTQQ